MSRKQILMPFRERRAHLNSESDLCVFLGSKVAAGILFGWSFSHSGWRPQNRRIIRGADRNNDIICVSRSYKGNTHTQCLFIYMCVCVRKHRSDSNYCVKTTYGNFIVHFIHLCVPSSRIFLAQSSSAVGGASLRRAADLIYCGYHYTSLIQQHLLQFYSLFLHWHKTHLKLA